MVIRTISQLPRTQNYYATALLEVSEPAENNMYSSKSMMLSTLRSHIEDSISAGIVTDYNMLENGQPVNLGQLKKDTETLSAGDMIVGGYKQYEKLPASTVSYNQLSNELSSAYGNVENNVIPNIGITKQLIVNKNPTHIGTTNSFVTDGNPFSSGAGKVNIQYRNTTGLDDLHYYMWSIEDNKQDSSETTWDINSGTRGDYEQMRKTGWLTVWGWLADRGDVDPTEAWVGIFGQIQYEGATNTTGTWFPIQIQPWIKGIHSSTLQYVGFNIPVQAGLRLKICTGFKVYGSNTGAFQDKPETLTFRDRWIPNTFFGYIIKNNQD